MNSDEICRIFTYQSPHGDQAARYARIRVLAHHYAELIHMLCPESHERDIAIDKLRETVMWANASIACNE